MLYKNSMTGIIYKSEKCVVNHRPNGTVKIHINNTEHTMNYPTTEAFEIALSNREVIFFSPCFKSISKDVRESYNERK